MDMPDAGCERGTPHLREIVLFLSVHLDRAPGVLWPEYDNPAFGDADDAGALPAGGGVRPAQADRFTAELGDLTGLSVRLDRVETPGSAPGGGPDAAWTAQPEGREHLLVHQIAGAVTWQLTGTGESGRRESFQCRLLPGELLYVPAGWSRRYIDAHGAQYAVVCLGPQGG
ncbi:hypothetical protein OG373_07215 [Streptomyces avidinii]|uniref:hypothetical protein n=1 Tax=Streptomyces avidinii TaxID=1895 RepID=UPI00386C423F|nr:hypothetical protein OG373_07215 [Streptomyces avidinii]